MRAANRAMGTTSQAGSSQFLAKTSHAMTRPATKTISLVSAIRRSQRTSRERTARRDSSRRAYSSRGGCVVVSSARFVTLNPLHSGKASQGGSSGDGPNPRINRSIRNPEGQNRPDKTVPDPGPPLKRSARATRKDTCVVAARPTTLQSSPERGRPLEDEKGRRDVRRVPPADPPLRLAPGHGGRLVEFGGWSMPVQYTTIVEEHQ